MQGKYNIQIDGKLYGVLWRGYPGTRRRRGYRNYKLAATPFGDAAHNNGCEIEEMLKDNENLKVKFLRGEQIKC